MPEQIQAEAFVTQCSYIYASGLRIKEGDGVVIVGGRALRLYGTHHADGHKFVDSAFDRLPDNSLHDILYYGLKDVGLRGEYLRLISDPLRLQRITEWSERGPRSVTGVRSPGYHVEFLSRVAHSVSAQLTKDAALAGALGA